MQTLTLAPLGREHLSAVYDGIMPAFGHLVAVPRAVPELCSGRVLTMEKLEGPKLEEEAKRQLLAVGVDVEQGSVTDFLKRGAKMAVAQDASSGATENGGSTTTTSSGSASQSTGAGLGRLGVAAVRVLGVERALRLGSGLAWLWGEATALTDHAVRGVALLGAAPQSWADWSSSVRQARSRRGLVAEGHVTRRWIDVLLQVHGHEVFLTDRFNADPHPGNVILMPDGRLGLIDYGQCKELAPEARRRLAAFVLAIAADRPAAEVAEAFRRCGMRTANDSDEFMADFGRLLFGRLEPAMMERGWHVRLHKLDRIVEFPTEMVMLYRMATLLRGLALALRYNVGVAEHWHAAARAAVGA